VGIDGQERQGQLERRRLNFRESSEADVDFSLLFPQRVSSADHHGKYVLIYFGFTKCPDICPNELRRMGEVLDTLGQAVEETMQPVRG
jgi:cytochrome oxidase Cu insertion factor (SCO1/SenC/PrrC family)